MIDTTWTTTLPTMTPPVSSGPRPALPMRPVVLLRSLGAGHRFARERALELAAALELPLLEVRLVSRTQDLERVQAARQRWERRLGKHHKLPGLVTLKSEGTEQLARALAALEAQVVVLSSTRIWPGDSVLQLATESGASCVIARRPRPDHSVMAASRMLDARLPVVREAAALAHALHRQLTVHHHVEPEIAQAHRPDLEPQVERLARAEGADVALTEGSDPVSGILSVARASDADVIVVGAPRSDSEASRRVAARVAALAYRSVMVVPQPS